MEAMRKHQEDLARMKLNLGLRKEKQRMENNAKIIKFKEELENHKRKKFEIIYEIKKKTHAEIREVRDKSIKEKYKMYSETVRENQKRSQSVKLDHKRQALKHKRLELSKEEENRQDYLRRVMQEEAKTKEIEEHVAEMETLEMELIRKLQNTQFVQAKTLSELEAAIKKKPSSAQNDNFTT